MRVPVNSTVVKAVRLQPLCVCCTSRMAYDITSKQGGTIDWELQTLTSHVAGLLPSSSLYAIFLQLWHNLTMVADHD